MAKLNKSMEIVANYFKYSWFWLVGCCAALAYCHQLIFENQSRLYFIDWIVVCLLISIPTIWIIWGSINFFYQEIKSKRN